MRFTPARGRLAAATLGLCIALGACSDTARLADRERADSAASDTATVRPATETPVAATDSIIVTVAFRRGEQVETVERGVPAAEPLRAALTALLAGPTAVERAAGIESWFSDSTRAMLHSVAVDDSLAVVDFADFSRIIPNASSSLGSSMLLAELNTTVFANSDAAAVEYRFDGSCDAFGEWVQRGCIRYHRSPSPAG